MGHEYFIDFCVKKSVFLNPFTHFFNVVVNSVIFASCMCCLSQVRHLSIGQLVLINDYRLYKDFLCWIFGNKKIPVLLCTKIPMVNLFKEHVPIFLFYFSLWKCDLLNNQLQCKFSLDKKQTHCTPELEKWVGARFISDLVRKVTRGEKTPAKLRPCGRVASLKRTNLLCECLLVLNNPGKSHDSARQ